VSAQRWLLGALALGLLWLGGFLWFVAQLGRAPVAGEADAIAVLTGSSERLHAGFELLRAGRGRRLLFSGVAWGTDPIHLRPVLAVDAAKATCCVDLERSAQNTRGNAAEIAAWARRHGFRRLIVVTSAYHMPRSLVELRAAMPEGAFLAHPVSDTLAPLGSWWHRPPTAMLLLGEYAKFLAALARTRLGL